MLALIQAINTINPTYNIIGFFDDGREKGQMVNPILGKTEELNLWQTELAIVVTVGKPIIKKRIINKITNTKIYYPTLIHPSVIIVAPDYVRIGHGCIICAGSIINTNTAVGIPAKAIK